MRETEWTEMLSDKNLKTLGQNSLNLVLIRCMPAKRNMQPFNLVGKSGAFAKPWKCFRHIYTLGTSHASLKHWPSP